MWGKKSTEKIAKNVFLYSHEYRAKKWGKKRGKHFFQKHTNSARKKVGKKIDGKSAKNVFLYLDEYRAEKKGKKGGKNLSRSIR